MDTVILRIYGPKKFSFSRKDWFLPEIASRKYNELSITEKNSNRYYLRRFILKAPAQSWYIPKVDVLEVLDKENKLVKYILIAEFSLPKLLYGNSVQEVTEKDLNRVIAALEHAFEKVGIKVEEGAIRTSRITAVHFCKNILLPEDIRLQDILAELQRVDLGKVVDITTKETKNGGRILHIYSGTLELVFYDKVTDALRPKIKRKDKGHMDYERVIIDKYHLQDREIFRFEYRIKKTQTVKREINRALKREPLTAVVFRDLFKPKLGQAVLLKAWQDLVGRPENQLALIGPIDNFKLLKCIIDGVRAQGRAHSMNKALIAYGLVCIVRDRGAKEFKQLMFSNWNDDHPERLNEKIAKASDLLKGISYSNGMAFVDAELNRFKPIKLTSHEITV
jgi:hypothetical protein